MIAVGFVRMAIFLADQSRLCAGVQGNRDRSGVIAGHQCSCRGNGGGRDLEALERTGSDIGSIVRHGRRASFNLGIDSHDVGETVSSRDRIHEIGAAYADGCACAVARCSGVINDFFLRSLQRPKVSDARACTDRADGCDIAAHVICC